MISWTVDPHRTLAHSSWIPMRDILGSLSYLWKEYMWLTCCWVLNDMGVARVNEIALTNACFILQTLTLKINEELGLCCSNGVTKNFMLILLYGEQDTHLVSPRTTQKMLPLN